MPLFWLLAVLLTPHVVVAATVLCVVVVVVVVYLFNIALFDSLEQHVQMSVCVHHHPDNTARFDLT